jgi:transposase, IS5 family
MVRGIGLARGESTIAFAAMAYNMKRWCWLKRRAASA